MVKLVQKADVQIDGGRVEQTSPWVEELAALADQNEASGQAETTQAAAKTESKKEQSLASEVEDALDMAAPFAEAGMWWLSPEQFEQYWGRASRKKIAVAAAAVMIKHGWELGAVLEKYAPYIALGMAFAPSAMATVQVYKQARAVQQSEALQGAYKKEGATNAATS